MSDVSVGIYGIIALLALFLTGLEMAYCMIVVGFFGFTFLMTFPAASSLVIKDFFDNFTTYSYTVIPLFIIMGEFASNSNIAKTTLPRGAPLVWSYTGRTRNDNRSRRDSLQGDVRVDARHRRDLFEPRHA